MSTEELSKAKKKLAKKLKQISALDMKASTGTVLSSDEEAKLKKKADILVAQDQLDRYL